MPQAAMLKLIDHHLIPGTTDQMTGEVGGSIGWGNLSREEKYFYPTIQVLGQVMHVKQ